MSEKAYVVDLTSVIKSFIWAVTIVVIVLGAVQLIGRWRVLELNAKTIRLVDECRQSVIVYTAVNPKANKFFMPMLEKASQQ